MPGTLSPVPGGPITLYVCPKVSPLNTECFNKITGEAENVVHTIDGATVASAFRPTG